MYSAVSTTDCDYPPEHFTDMEDRDSVYFDTISVAGSEPQQQSGNNRKSLSLSRQTIYHSAVDLPDYLTPLTASTNTIPEEKSDNSAGDSMLKEGIRNTPRKNPLLQNLTGNNYFNKPQIVKFGNKVTKLPSSSAAAASLSSSSTNTSGRNRHILAGNDLTETRSAIDITTATRINNDPYTAHKGGGRGGTGYRNEIEYKNYCNSTSRLNGGGGASGTSGGGYVIPGGGYGDEYWCSLENIDPIHSWNKFQDGSRSVDFVLAYKVDNVSQNYTKRQIFEANLRAEGLELEQEKAQNTVHFVKIHAPHEVLCRYCEILKIKLPIRKMHEQELISEPEFELLHKLKSFFGKPFEFVKLDPKIFPQKEYTLSLEYSRQYDYLFDRDNPNLFSPSTRSAVVNFILERQRFCDDKDNQNNLGIERLLNDGVYESAFPLHDGDCHTAGSQRTLLLHEWASIKKWIKHQPLENIKDYFGVKIALYFAWLGFYAHMLIPASIVGIICFLYGLATLGSDTVSQDICKEDNDIIMCPQCDMKCDYWYLKETCTYSKVNYIFDNNMTVFFAFFMSFWATLYLELWKRYSANLIHRWGLIDFSVEVEHPRPQYMARLSESKRTKFNAVHRVLEPHVPYWKMKFPMYFLSFSSAFLFICLAIAAVFSLVVYRMSQTTSRNIYGNTDSMSYKIMVLPATAAIIDLIVITILNYAYDYLAIYLTNLEYRRTQTEYDESLTLKIYLFQFINYYSSIFYIAFLKGKFVGYPAKYNRIYSLRQEECGPGGCLMELCIQLVIIMIGKQAINAILEMLIPYLTKTYNNVMERCGFKEQKDKENVITCNQWTQDYKLSPWTLRGLFEEYLEMVIQYGFITIFVVAFPLAPVFALINNVLETRLDAKKILKYYRKPVPQRVKDIGVWYHIMDIIGRIAVISSAFIIAFSSNLIPKLVYMTISPDRTENGYLNFTLAYFNTNDFQNGTAPIISNFSNVSICRYPEFRNPPWDENPYKRPLIYWRILAARLAFIVVFQNIVGCTKTLVSWAIPDIPGKLRNCIKREEYLKQQIIIEHEKSRFLQEQRNQVVRDRDSIEKHHSLRKSLPENNFSEIELHDIDPISNDDGMDSNARGSTNKSPSDRITSL